jgi:GT2 family glycosyltransferase
VGIKFAKHDLIAITDAGCRPHPNWLQELRRKATEYQLENGILSGLVVAGYYDAKPITPFEVAVVPYALVMPDQVDSQTFLPATRSMLLHKNVWTALDGFDEKLSDNEDYDFARRLRKLAEQQNQSGYELPVEIVFAVGAKVTWLPRSTWHSFANMIYRFARGDARAGLWRPKVGLIFLRYIVVLSIGIVLLSDRNWLWLGIFLLMGAILYSIWSIFKNKRYVPRGWYWLPVLQVTADVAVMLGTLQGVVKRVLI